MKIKCFEGTSSSKLEFQTFLWALQDSSLVGCAIEIYTDSQAIVRLHQRRARLEANAYCSKKGKPLKLAGLYQDFFKATDELHCTFIHVPGHHASGQTNEIRRIFSLVDQAARMALRGSAFPIRGRRSKTSQQVFET